MSVYEPLPTSDVDISAPPQQPPSLHNQTSFYRRSARHFILLAFVSVIALVSFKAGQWSVTSEAGHQADASISIAPPSSPSTTRFVQPTAPVIPPSPSNETMSGKYSVGYFVNWGIYGRKFPPSLIPAQDLTHILYAFFKVDSGSGEVTLSDPWADKDIHYPGDSWNDSGDNLYGNFKAIYKLKQQHRHLKLILSIGGWTYSPQFHPVVVNPAARAKFVSSSIALLEDLGADGIDVDYEYPNDDAQARGYVDLLRELRAGLDEHARRKSADYRFLLTIATPCGASNYEKLHVRAMDESLDFWNMMAYDFAGSWDSQAGHQSNLYGEPLSVAKAIDWYMRQGVHPAKIVMGVPLYGRSFMGTKGPGHPYNGVGPGSWEQGVYDYRVLPLPGTQMYADDQLGASWSHNYQTGEMISFDSEAIARRKGAWIRERGLGGSMFWELSGDKNGPREDMEGGPGKEPQPGRSLVQVVKEGMGGLDQSPNWLRYEGSRYENMRNGMPS